MSNFNIAIQVSIAILASILYYLIIKKLSNRYILKKGRIKYHPLELTLLYNISFLSMPGVILISFFNFDSWRYKGIDYSLLFEIGLWYFFSVFIITTIIYSLLFIFPLKNYIKYTHLEINYSEFKKGLWGLLLLSIFVVIFKYLILPKPPAMYFLTGDIAQGYITRIDMQNNPSKYYLPYIKQFVELLIMLQGYLGFYIYINTPKKKIITVYFLLSFLLCLWESFYTGQKAPMFLYIAGLVFIYLSKYTVNLKVIISIILIPTGVFLLYTNIMELGDSDSLSSIVDRLFLGQNQGFYNIIAHIVPSDKYLFEGMPFINKFDIEPSRADIDILPWIYGNRTDLVNSNSYFLGQAWSMYGYLGLFIAPFLVAISIYLFIKTIDYITPLNPIVITPFLFYTVYDLRINQSFTYFIFAKTIILNLIFLLLILLIFRLFNAKFVLGKKNY
ncbi:oligosaccharide repeat unit polymerase [Providencia stuartii]|uniref:oligosaccharide repeat unit polymerase n=1 Tax=Providencia TaxID=586 RepID=UPI000DE72C94|nr:MULTISPECIES: oligosaccharide repeat unit polymerase [Providencia]SST05135.1 Uncharacterised protein [Acinetobacter baumannii]MBQ0458565.1 oligosaccharide repeat unit polymerase [Providencia stuartii]QPN40522.1 oligosaccharide repeat unit polymerase [Providencia sp. 2.29]WAZ78853.1 oligosaccharide repeat unit polymerase [Providencia stuartii]WAZ83843.1 oligosaccharide repeat unit polymerase [Providencia stuartii]